MSNIPKEQQKHCYFCVNNIQEIDYKDTKTLEKFINYHRNILSARRTGTCAKHQRKLAKAVKRAKIMALLSHTPK